MTMELSVGRASGKSVLRGMEALENLVHFGIFMDGPASSVVSFS